MIVFDVDGVIADSRRLVRECYDDAGVDMPDDAWGRPWHEWLDDEHVHARKNQLYIEAVKAGRLPILDGAEVVRHFLAQEARVGFATGSSYLAFVAVYRQSSLYDLVCDVGQRIWWRVGCTTRDKIVTLRKWHAKVYVDDNEELGERIAEAAGCKFVHYVPGRPDEIIERISAWTQSS